MSDGADVRGRAARRDPSLVLMRGGSGYAGWRWWGSGVCRWERVGAGWRGRWGGGRDGGLGVEWVYEVLWGVMMVVRGFREMGGFGSRWGGGEGIRRMGRWMGRVRGRDGFQG